MIPKIGTDAFVDFYTEYLDQYSGSKKDIAEIERTIDNTEWLQDVLLKLLVKLREKKVLSQKDLYDLFPLHGGIDENH